MFTHSVAYHHACLWEKGRRISNEDSIAFSDIYSGHEHILLAAVADGIGGLDMGSFASGYVIRQLLGAFEEHTRTGHPCTPYHLTRLFNRTLYSAHRYLTDYGIDHGTALGSTISLICINGTKAIYMHAGDSRLYRLTPDKQSGSALHRAYSTNHALPLSAICDIKPVGTDHTACDGRLTRCIGYGGYSVIPGIRFTVSPGETLLICTDGFWRKGEGDFLPLLSGEHIRGGDDLERALKDIYRDTYKKGETDNQSAVAVRPVKIKGGRYL